MKSAGKLTDVRSVNKSSAMEFRLVLGLICGWGGLRPFPAVIAVRLLLRLDTDLTLRAVSRWIPHIGLTLANNNYCIQHCMIFSMLPSIFHNKCRSKWLSLWRAGARSYKWSWSDSMRIEIIHLPETQAIHCQKSFVPKQDPATRNFMSYNKDFSSSEPASLLATQCFGHLSSTSPPHVCLSCWPEALRWDSSCQPLRTPRPDSLCSLIINLNGGCESIGPMAHGLFPDFLSN